MIDDYTNQARKPVCRFDNDLFRSDDCNDKTGILMDRCRVMVGMHQGPDSCKYPVRNEGTAAQYPSKFPVRAEGTPAQYPSNPSVRTQGIPAQYTSNPSVRTQGTSAQYTRTASVSQPPAVTRGKRKLPIDKKMVKTKDDLELFLQTDGGKKWKRHGPIKFEFGYRHNDAIFYSSSTDEGMVLTEEVVMNDYTFKLFQWVLDFDGEWDLIPLMGPRKKIKRAPTKAEDAFVDSLLK